MRHVYENRCMHGGADSRATLAEIYAVTTDIDRLQDVRPGDSVALLESLVSSDSTRTRGVSSSVLQALSQHGEPSAPMAIERLARSHRLPSVRGDALLAGSSPAKKKGSRS